MPSPRPPLLSRAPQRSFGRRLAAAGTCAALVAGAAMTAIAMPATAAIVAEPIVYEGSGALALAPVGTLQTPEFDAGAAEIVSYHAATQQLFIVNAVAGAVQAIDVSDPSAPTLIDEIVAEGAPISGGGTIPAGAVANSVAVTPGGLVVVAVEAPTKTDTGWMLSVDATTRDVLGAVSVGAQPDSVAVSGDGAYAVLANEGEPSDDYLVDPVGSISIVDLPGTVAASEQSAVRTVGFEEFEADGTRTLPEGIRVFAGIDGIDLPVSRSIEPEYASVAPDDVTAYVSLQEANGLAIVNLVDGTLELAALGSIDRGVVPMTMSDRTANLTERITVDGIEGLFMPDTIDTYEVGGETYVVTANEGDAREWGDYEEPVRVQDLALCDTIDTTNRAAFDRLEVSIESPQVDDCYSALHAFGTRSFSIWDSAGTLVSDSGESLERITAEALPEFFNAGNDDNVLGSRNDAKGPEPEAVAIGEVDGRQYAFIGLERVGGIAVYDVTVPTAPEFTTYINNRDFSLDVEADIAAVGDSGPESIVFLPAGDSPTGRAMIAVGNEITGTTTLYSVTPQTTIQVLGINDFHGRLEANRAEAGAAVIAGAVGQLRAENPNTVFASAGDMIGASTFTSFSQQDNPTIDAFVAAGLDVGAVGNHEFDAGFADLTDRVLPRYGDPRYGLGANVYLAGTETPAHDEFWVTELDGVRVGFIGTVTGQTASLVSPAGIAGIEFGDPVEAANRVAAQLSNGEEGDGEADVIVSLVHEGPDSADCATLGAADDAFGSIVRDSSSDIDAIFAGHTHIVVDCAFPVAGSGVERPVVMGGQYGTHLAQVELTVDTETLEVTGASRSVIPLAPGNVAAFPADAAVAQIVADAVEAAAVVGDTVVGSVTADITRAFDAGGVEDRGAESSLGNLIADIQLWATSNESFGGEPAQIALMNPGGIRADLLLGDDDGVTTYRDVASVQPFANTLFTQDLTGAQLKQVLEEQWQPAGSSRPKLHLGVSEGFEYVYDESLPQGERILELRLNGEPIAADDVVRVVANSFLANGGDNFTTLAEGTNRTDTGQVDLAAAVAYFEEFEVVEPAPLGRAIIGSDDWATVSLRLDGLRAGDTVPVTVSGLEPGQTISGALLGAADGLSTAAAISLSAVELGMATANAEGVATFALVLPRDLAAGAYVLEVASQVPGELPIRVELQIAAAPAAVGAGAGGVGGVGGLPVTGAEAGGLLALALGLLGAGAATFTLRRRASRSLATVAGE
ncbi:choice-of-anchor I family protein [Microcella daejeonensis]|uniref:choice-of-anchor I family protein n=1 Tax=Microcella daejeonensis TaxID=2994971 RepID=UPI00226E7341|nr:choice-of-anchor I family protein [Microcella daejeonensis]WAB84281.1 choice-of-anchor I family protein [Microcella daejeonensis]